MKSAKKTISDSDLKQEQIKIGLAISDSRELKGMTQKQFAKALGTSQSAIARMEKGEQNLTTETLAKISQVLGHSILTLSDQSMSFRVTGGKKLSGKITTNTSKNAAVALLFASLLNKGTTVLRSVPRIEEVFRITEVLESIGVSLKWHAGNDLEITPPKKLHWNKIDKDSAVRTRSILMLIAPLLHQDKSFKLPLSGGCELGTRTVRPHLFALEHLGVDIVAKHDYYLVNRNKLTPAEIVLYESGDTATENAIMTACLIPGKTTIKFASSNYMVRDLCYFLNLCGVKIEGIGTTTLVVHGQKEINKKVTYTLSEDPIESMMFLSLAITTKSQITIQRCPIDFLELELLKLEKMGFKYKMSKRYKSKNKFSDLVDITTYPSWLKALDEKIYSRPFPGLNIDNLPFFVPIATQAKGTTLIHDWVYENRAVYYLELNKLRANIRQADPHRVYVEGVTELRSADIICPPALRPAAIILIGMLSAKGVSTLSNVYSINRGYEDLARRLRTIGAKIEVLYGV